MAGEMGRTPKISTLPQYHGKPGRDHWGTQTVFFAGGGVHGGNVIGSTDKIGAFPAANPQKPENMAATIYRRLASPARSPGTIRQPPPFVYHGEPIAGLTGSGPSGHGGPRAPMRKWDSQDSLGGQAKVQTIELRLRSLWKEIEIRSSKLKRRRALSNKQQEPPRARMRGSRRLEWRRLRAGSVPSSTPSIRSVR